MKRKIPYQERVINLVQNNLVIVFIWILVVSLGAISKLIQDFNVIRTTYKNSIDVKSSEYEKLSKLSTRVSIDYFKDILGTPRIVRNNEPVSNKEYVFINKYYYVMATTDKNEIVETFAVTSRDETFKPTFKVPDGYNNMVGSKITLNSDTFSNYHSTLEANNGNNIPNCYSDIWPKGFSYIEGYYLGGSGEYQSFFVGLNDAGNLGTLKKDDFSIEQFEAINQDPSKCKPNDFRENRTFNTYMLSNSRKESALGEDNMAKSIGVASSEVNGIE